MMRLNPRQAKVLNAIIAYYETEGFLPSYDELRKLAELKSVSTVHYHMKQLLEKGFLSKVPGKSRAYKIIYNAKGEPYHFEAVDARNILTIPVLTTEMTGKAIFDKAYINEYLYLPEIMFGQKEGFALKVLSNVMADEGVLSGDYLLFVEAQEAGDKDLVIILSGDEISSARYEYTQGVTNYSLFGDREPIYADSAMMIGRVVGMYRNLKQGDA